MLKLEKMDRKSYQDYRKESLARIVNDYVGSGYYKKEEAARMAEELFMDMLPRGTNTPGQFLYNITHNKEKIGILWYGVMNKEYGYINDFFINEEHRDLENETLKLLEEHARNNGVKSLEVSAYANTPKMSLFESRGYKPYFVRLLKKIS